MTPEDFVRFKHSESEEYKRKVIELLWSIHYWPLGRELLEKLSRIATSRFRTPKLYIENFPPHHDYRGFQARGYLPDDDALLYFDLNRCLRKPYDIDPTQEYVVQCNKTYVYLFHELVHYYHDLLGRFKAGGDLDEEYRTVGLYEYTNEGYSENAFRKQVQLDRRPCYIWNWQRSPPEPRLYPLYEQEKQKRAALGLPEQTTLKRQSPECRFDGR